MIENVFIVSLWGMNFLYIIYRDSYHYFYVLKSRMNAGLGVVYMFDSIFPILKGVGY